MGATSAAVYFIEMVKSPHILLGPEGVTCASVVGRERGGWGLSGEGRDQWAHTWL